MKSIAELGLKITERQREYYRYTGVSAEMERKGVGSSRSELAWVYRSKQEIGRLSFAPFHGSENTSQNRS